MGQPGWGSGPLVLNVLPCKVVGETIQAVGGTDAAVVHGNNAGLAVSLMQASEPADLQTPEHSALYGPRLAVLPFA